MAPQLQDMEDEMEDVCAGNEVYTSKPLVDLFLEDEEDSCNDSDYEDGEDSDGDGVLSLELEEGELDDLLADQKLSPEKVTQKFLTYTMSSPPVFQDSEPEASLRGETAPPLLPEFPFVWGRWERRMALENWSHRVTNMKQRYLARVESETFQLSVVYAVRKEKLEEQIKKLEEWYAEEVDKLRYMSDRWSDDVDEKLEDAAGQIEDLERRLKRTTLEQKQQDPDPPAELCCPITKQLMIDPVTASDGYTYERSEIERIFAETPADQVVISPAAGEQALLHRTLVPSVTIRNLIQKYQAEHNPLTEGSGIH